MSTRIIYRAADRPHRSISEALETLAVAEVLSPGRRFMAVSPWITDFPIVDNRNGAMSVLDRSWPAGRIPFSFFLRTLLRKGVNVSVACGNDALAVEFLNRVRASARQDGTDDRLRTKVSGANDPRLLEHGKALVADSWAVHGSMNLTFRGVEVNGELVTVTNEPDQVGLLAIALGELFR